MSGIPFVDLKAQYARLKPQIENAIQDVLDDGRYILGPAVERLESELAEYCGVRHAISCASGTDAIFMPLLAYGIGPGDAVFVQDGHRVESIMRTNLQLSDDRLAVGLKRLFVDVV